MIFNFDMHLGTKKLGFFQRSYRIRTLGIGSCNCLQRCQIYILPARLQIYRSSSVYFTFMNDYMTMCGSRNTTYTTTPCKKKVFDINDRRILHSQLFILVCICSHFHPLSHLEMTCLSPQAASQYAKIREMKGCFFFKNWKCWWFF